VGRSGSLILTTAPPRTVLGAVDFGVNLGGRTLGPDMDRCCPQFRTKRTPGVEWRELGLPEIVSVPRERSVKWTAITLIRGWIE
jgi:hypothetical protein